MNLGIHRPHVRFRGSRPIAFVVLFLAFASFGTAFDAGANDVVAVSSLARKDYKRSRGADGTYSPESYAFGKGGDWAGFAKDYSIDGLSFLDVAHMIAGPLAAQRFYPTKDPAKTSLLIMVYWGTTHAPFPADESPEMANLQQAYENIFRDSGPYIIGSAGVGQEPGWSPISGARVPVSRMGEIAAAQELVAAANFRRENEDLVNIKMLGYDSWLERTDTTPGEPPLSKTTGPLRRGGAEPVFCGADGLRFPARLERRRNTPSSGRPASASASSIMNSIRTFPLWPRTLRGILARTATGSSMTRFRLARSKLGT